MMIALFYLCIFIFLNLIVEAAAIYMLSFQDIIVVILR